MGGYFIFVVPSLQLKIISSIWVIKRLATKEKKFYKLQPLYLSISFSFWPFIFSVSFQLDCISASWNKLFIWIQLMQLTNKRMNGHSIQEHHCNGYSQDAAQTLLSLNAPVTLTVPFGIWGTRVPLTALACMSRMFYCFSQCSTFTNQSIFPLRLIKCFEYWVLNSTWCLICDLSLFYTALSR